MKKVRIIFSVLICLGLILSLSFTPLTREALAVDETPPSYPMGPNLDQFPAGFSPLTGLPVSDPSWLELPAVLVSLSHFPPTVRPQTGLSFAPQVYEIYITEGMTRFLTVFYGEAPQTLPTPAGLTPRTEPLHLNGAALGGRVYWDRNADGAQQPDEPGLGGFKVQLVDFGGSVVKTIVTDANGYYAFSPRIGKLYLIRVLIPEGFRLAVSGSPVYVQNNGSSNAAQTKVFGFHETNLAFDFGLDWDGTDRQAGENQNQNNAIGGIEQPQDPGLAGVRSGREAYVPIAAAFPNGCLVAASKSSEVNLRICRSVFGSNSQDINSAGLSVAQLRRLAEANRNPSSPPNYSGNVFDPQPPAGGQPAGQVNVFYAYLNQARWIYDAAAGAYWRYNDLGSESQAGQFVPATDRLTNRTLLFENVVVLFVEHTARTTTIIDLNMQPGTKGKAIVFRNGQVYTNVYWSMVGEEYEKTTGLTRPVRLRYADGTPFPLAPGQTWLHIATTSSTVYEEAGQPGVWKFRFYPPKGAK